MQDLDIKPADQKGISCNFLTVYSVSQTFRNGFEQDEVIPPGLPSIG